MCVLQRKLNKAIHMLFPYVKKHNVKTMNDTPCQSGLRFLTNGKCMWLFTHHKES